MEEVGHPGGIDNLHLNSQMQWDVTKQGDLLEGVNVITGKSQDVSSALVAVPYYSWSNRGIGAMKVWLRFDK